MSKQRLNLREGEQLRLKQKNPKPYGEVWG